MSKTRYRVLVLILGVIFIVSGCSDKQTGNEFKPPVLVKDYLRLGKGDLGTDSILSPFVYGDKLYYSRGDFRHSYGELIEYDLVGKQHKTLFKSKYEMAALQNIAANDRYIVFTDSRDTGADMSEYYIDKKTGRCIRLNKTPVGILPTPLLYKHYAISFDRDSNGSTYLVLYDMENKGAKKRIHKFRTLYFYNFFYGVSTDGIIVWNDHENSRGYTYYYDIERKKLNKYKTIRKFPGYSQIAGGRIFSLSFNDNDWSNQIIEVYDMQKQELIEPAPIKMEGHINQLDALGDYVVLTDVYGNIHVYIANSGKKVKLPQLFNDTRYVNVVLCPGGLLVGEIDNPDRSDNALIDVINLNRYTSARASTVRPIRM